MTIKAFVSHCSADRAAAVAFVDLLRCALKLDNEEIRCTSAPGCKLPGGAPIEKMLLAEISTAPVFIALISRASLSAQYPGVELGARLSVDRGIIPVMCPGEQRDILREPLAGRNVLSSGDSTDLHQVVEEARQALGLAPVRAVEYNAQLLRILELSTPSSIKMPEVEDAAGTETLASVTSAIVLSARPEALETTRVHDSPGKFGLFVLASVGPDMGGEMTGAEFRVVGVPDSWTVVCTPSAHANLTIGNPIGDGANIAFPNAPATQGGLVLLFALAVTAPACDAPVVLAVQGHRRPVIARMTGPLLVMNDGPVFSKLMVGGGTFAVL